MSTARRAPREPSHAAMASPSPRRLAVNTPFTSTPSMSGVIGRYPVAIKSLSKPRTSRFPERRSSTVSFRCCAISSTARHSMRASTPRSFMRLSGVKSSSSESSRTRPLKKYGSPQMLYAIRGPASSTVMSRLGSSRLARDAAVIPAALPPMTRMRMQAQSATGACSRR